VRRMRVRSLDGGKHANHCLHRRRGNFGSKVGLKSESGDEPEGMRVGDTER